MPEKEQIYGYLLVNDVELAELVVGRVPPRVVDRAIVLSQDLMDRLRENAARNVEKAKTRKARA